MISITGEATKALKDYFADKEVTPIRIYLAQGGCSGPCLALAVDEPDNGDETKEHEGMTFAIDKELLKMTGAVTVDASVHGFSVTSEKPIGGGGGCGSGCCGGCSCG